MEKRLQNILALSGVASRRASAELILGGFVEVDGRVVREKGLRLDPEKHRIKVKGKEIGAPEKKYYFLLNKPPGYISTVSDTHGRRKVLDLFADIPARLYPVGRLDKDTTGVLIVTNDGELAHRLAHPGYEVEKEYRVTVDKALDKITITRMSEGVDIEGKKTSPCLIKAAGGSKDKNVYSVRLHEGRKRQIKKMFESVGAVVRELDRVKYAGLSCKSVPVGSRRELTRDEVTRLKKICRNKRRRGDKHEGS